MNSHVCCDRARNSVSQRYPATVCCTSAEGGTSDRWNMWGLGSGSSLLAAGAVIDPASPQFWLWIGKGVLVLVVCGLLWLMNRLMNKVDRQEGAISRLQNMERVLGENRGTLQIKKHSDIRFDDVQWSQSSQREPSDVLPRLQSLEARVEKLEATRNSPQADNNLNSPQRQSVVQQARSLSFATPVDALSNNIGGANDRRVGVQMSPEGKLQEATGLTPEAFAECDDRQGVARLFLNEDRILQPAEITAWHYAFEYPPAAVSGKFRTERPAVVAWHGLKFGNVQSKGRVKAL